MTRRGGPAPTLVVPGEHRPAALPPPVIDVYPISRGGWRACCDCGLTEAVLTQVMGWSWLLDHECMAPLATST